MASFEEGGAAAGGRGGGGAGSAQLWDPEAAEEDYEEPEQR